MQPVLAEPVLRAQFEDLEIGLRAVPGPFEEAHFTFGGRVARVRVAGGRLASLLTRPFSHLRRDPPTGGAVELDINLWAERETGVPRPHYGPVTADGVTEVSDTGRWLQHRTRYATVSFDRRTGRMVGAFTLPDRVGVYDRGKPLARLLAEWYADQGVAVTHAGLVASGADGVLLAGRGGSGKSTTTLACARAGFDFLGEDYAALEFQENDVIGHSAYNSVFVAPQTAVRFPELTPHLFPSHDATEPKSVVLLADVWPSQLVARVRIRAVALCRVGDAPASRVRPASRVEALIGIAPSSLLQIHGRRRDSLNRLARLVERIPAFHLELGHDLARVPHAVDEVLRMGRRT